MKSINLNPYDYVDYSKKYRENKNDEAYVPEPGSLSYSFGTTEHECYILDLTERNGVRERLEIQFVPGEITGQRTASLKEIEVIGRNNPFLHYTGGKETISLNLEFYSDIESHDDVKLKIDWLRSLTINDGKIGKHPKVKVVFGDLFRWETFSIKNVQYKYTHLDSESKWLPLRATATITLQIDTEQDVSIKDLRR